MKRLRPKGARKPATPPGPESLHNPYGRYFTAPRSFEQLVQKKREQAAHKPEREPEKHR